MGSRSRPAALLAPAARIEGMRAALLLAALVAVSGCSNAVVKASFNSNFTTPPPPVAVSGGQASVRVTSTGGGAAIASMLFLGTLYEPRRTAPRSCLCEFRLPRRGLLEQGSA